MDTRTRVDLPPEVMAPFEVFVNGVLQSSGRDYELIGRSLVFPRVLRRERKLAPWRWVLMFLGVWSSYRPFDSVDVVHTVDGKRLVSTVKPAGVSHA